MIEVFANTAGRFGIKPKEAERFLKFAMVGLIGAVVDFGVFNLLRWLFLQFVTSEEMVTWAVTGAQTISFLAAIGSNFLWNRYWTYPDSRSKSFRRQFAQFALVNFLGIFIRAPFVWATHDWLGDVIYNASSFDLDLARTLGDNISVALAVGIVMFWNFFVNRYWTYNDVSP
jgi:putative flippase GtrA